MSFGIPEMKVEKVSMLEHPNPTEKKPIFSLIDKYILYLIDGGLNSFSTFAYRASRAQRQLLIKIRMLYIVRKSHYLLLHHHLPSLFLNKCSSRYVSFHGFLQRLLRPRGGRSEEVHGVSQLVTIPER